MRLRNNFLFIPAALLSALLALSATAHAAQQLAHDPTAQDTTTTDANSGAPSMTPEQIALIDRYLTTVNAEPAGQVDTKNAAAGQGITLHVTADATLANGAHLPKGTQLTGRILRAQAWQPQGSAALLSIGIDRAVLKDGSSVPIRCVIRMVTRPAGPSTNLVDASQPGSRPRRSSGGSSIGGPTGGAIPIGDPTPMGGSIGAGSSAGDIGNSPLGGGSSSGTGNGYPGDPNSASTRGGVSGGGIGTGDPGIGGSTGRIPMPNTTAVAATADPELPVTAAGESIHDTPRPSGLPGVLLSGASVAGVSGTLSAFERNFMLDSGMQLTLGVITTQ